MSETVGSKDVTKQTQKQEYTVLKDGHTHKGVKLSKGDKLTPKSEVQYNFLKTNGVI